MTFPVTGSIFRTGEAGPSDPYNRLSSARLYSSALTFCRVLLRRNRLRGFREPRNAALTSHGNGSTHGQTLQRRRQETSKFIVALLPIFGRFRGLQILDLEPQVRLDAT